MNHGLIAAMAEAGETAESLADQMGVDPKTAQRWVNPGRMPRPRYRSRIATLLGRDVGDLWPDVLKRSEPAWFRPWADIEHDAVALRGFELVWVPGLLQTEAYARATLAGESLITEEVDELVAARIGRQEILHRPRPPLIVAVIDEAALRRPAARGDGALMREQCEHLAACAEMPHIQVQIVPAGTPMYPGMGGPFVLAEMPDGTRVSHVDGQVNAQIISDQNDIATLEQRWARIVGEALPRAASLDLIRRAAAEWT
ncbi:Scr1 family TA system antitoxin-like transcriptional regulator [Micromonospora haikouensis]|uniref:Scr1 family TA system antitoxin-like transcriptional regulator n=1 Tax=Micromonospora haikouensis TaxID=686309 RepID=UPI003D72281C